MCFGSSQQSTQQTQVPQWLQTAGENNVKFGENLQSTGFNPYTGSQVAQFAPQQQTSFNNAGTIANTATGNVPLGGQALNEYLGSGGIEPTVNPETISSQMSPYMNQYVGMALNPQIAAANNQFSLNQQLTQGAATSAGAFGDPRANLLQQNQQLNNNLSMQGLVGNAYNSAFNTAIGAGAQDVANNLQGQTTNAGLYNTGLQNLLTGSNAAYQQGTGANQMLNTYGGQQTAQSQAQLNAAYNQWMMAQQYPFQTSQLLNQDMGVATPMNQTTTLTQPNNAGYGILGSLLGGAGGMIGSSPGMFGGGSGILGLAALSDERTKTDKKKIGELDDGLNIYRFRYKTDPPGTKRVGVMAQEAERKYPSAVVEIGGLKHVDYSQIIDANTPSFGIAA